MKWTLTVAHRPSRSLLASPACACADGELNIYNWGNYTSPELIKKFEETYKVKVTVTDYDSNDTALAKVTAGGHGFDIVVPSARLRADLDQRRPAAGDRPDQMENFKNMDPKWVDVHFDPGRQYTVPWQWGTTGVIVNTEVYKGDINTWAIFFDPPDELKGKVNVVPEMGDVMYARHQLYRRRAVHRRQGGAEEGARQAGRGQAELDRRWTTAPSRRCAKGDIGGRRQLERLGVPRAAAERRRSHYGYPKEGYRDLDGQCRRAQGRQERRERQAVPELHHGSARMRR